MLTTTRRLKTAAYMKTSLTSIMGPKTRKESLAAREKLSMGAAMKASEVLQRESTKARDIMDGMAIQSLAANLATWVWST